MRTRRRGSRDTAPRTPSHLYYGRSDDPSHHAIIFNCPPRGSRTTGREPGRVDWCGEVAWSGSSTRRLGRLRAVGGLGRRLAVGLHELGLRSAGTLQVELLVDLFLDLVRHRGVLTQEGLCVVAALAEPFALVAEERARLLHDAVLDPEVDQT